MPVVTTGLISTPVPGAWRRLSLITSDGGLTGLRDEELTGRLEELGVPRHQYGLARLVRSWQRSAIPPDVALALWLLRERLEIDGCLYRRKGVRVEESGPPIRYIQLATSAGETIQTDPWLLTMAHWLTDRQLPDGSIPANIDFGHGEAGSTARTLRALSRLDDPSLDDATKRMAAYLEGAAVPCDVGVGWSYSPQEPTVVTGATSLALLALIERGCRGRVVTEGLRFLLHAQTPAGGWAEVPGYAPMVHNTFNAVRTLKAAEAAGLLETDPAPTLARTRAWFLRSIRRPPASTLDISYALRLAAKLDLLGDRKVERLALALTQRRRQTLSMATDIYAETQIMALAMLECSRELDREEPERWRWRWALPALPPPFLSSEAYFYELLYSAFKARWWVRTVDALANAAVVERVAGLLLGTIVALSLVDDRLTNAFVITGWDARRIVATAFVGLLLALWFSVKATARRQQRQGATWATAAALGLAATMTWILPLPPAPPEAVTTQSVTLPNLLLVVALRWLIIDIVALTADRTGLLQRLLPK